MVIGMITTMTQTTTMTTTTMKITATIKMTTTMIIKPAPITMTTMTTMIQKVLSHHGCKNKIYVLWSVSGCGCWC